MSTGQIVLLPLLQVELVSNTAQLTTIALLDSGATTSFIPYEIADILDLIPETPRSTDVVTAGGPANFFPIKLERLSLLAGGMPFSDFRKFRALVPFDSERDLPYVLLGRDSVFKRFYITFKENIKKFVMEHHKWARARGN